MFRRNDTDTLFGMTFFYFYSTLGAGVILCLCLTYDISFGDDTLSVSSAYWDWTGGQTIGRAGILYGVFFKYFFFSFLIPLWGLEEDFRGGAFDDGSDPGKVL